MPRVQVYLPEDLYRVVKGRGLSPSELLQRAVRLELRRLNAIAASDRYVGELIAAVGQPAARHRARAKAMARRIARRAIRKAG